MKPQTRKPYPLLPITGPQMQPILKNMLSHCWTVGSPNLERQEAAGQILLYNFPKNKDKQHFNHHTHHLVRSKVLSCILSSLILKLPTEYINKSEEHRGLILKKNGVNRAGKRDSLEFSPFP